MPLKSVFMLLSHQASVINHVVGHYSKQSTDEFEKNKKNKKTTKNQNINTHCVPVLPLVLKIPAVTSRQAVHILHISFQSGEATRLQPRSIGTHRLTKSAFIHHFTVEGMGLQVWPQPEAPSCTLQESLLL